MKLLTPHILLNSINPRLQSNARPLPHFLSETAPTQISPFHHPDVRLHTIAGWRKKEKNVHLYFISRATNRFSRRAERQTERETGRRNCVKGERGGEAALNMSAFIFSLKRELLKISFWRECGPSIRLSGLPSLLSRVLLWGVFGPT